MTRTVTVLGATGSIGRQTLEVIRAHREHFDVGALTAYSRMEPLIDAIREFEPALVGVSTRVQAEQIRSAFPSIRVLYGDDAAKEIAVAVPGALIVNALVGSVGIEPTIAALANGFDVALANKETLVAAGPLVLEAAAKGSAKLVPIDSEHTALYQCLLGHSMRDVARVIITASGGPFRTYTIEQLQTVSIADAMAHPTWNMGPKNTVDSATLMNKGLEVIEAHYFYQLPYDAIDVIVHPQSIVHAIVEFHDGAMIAHLSERDMKLSIQYAILQPGPRLTAPWPRLDLAHIGSLTFMEPDLRRFPALRIAYECGRAGRSYPAVMNAANEMAVEAFLRGDIPYIGIHDVVQRVLDRHRAEDRMTLSAMLTADAWARREAVSVMQTGGVV